MAQGDRADIEDNAIAVIGLSGRFPGASNVAAFWKNLREGRETIRVFSEQELLASGVPLEVVRGPGIRQSLRLSGRDRTIRRCVLRIIAARCSGV